MLCTSKESLENVEFRFRCKEIDFFEKKIFFSTNFLIFFSKPLMSKHNFFLIFQNFQENILKMAAMRPKEC